MSNDVHMNPGPVQESCSKCNQGHTKATIVKCETCYQWCHLNCTKPNKEDISTISEKSFEWICPNPLCAPTYQLGIKVSIPLSTNRYETLIEHVENIQNSKKNNLKVKMTCKKWGDATKEDTKRKELFKQLPRISSREYQGKDICKICLKTVGENQRAVSCDSCERWLHVKCTDMEARTYNKLREKKRFNWNCHRCREEELSSISKVDLRKLKPEECPVIADELAGSKYPLLLSINCRSILNKVDELKDICYNLNPMIVCLTITWMDHTVPHSFIVPEGYSIIRKDRTENFKQRYGKANGGGIAVLHKNNVKVKVKDIADKDDETLWLEITTKKKILIGLVYRATYTDLLTEIDGNTKLNNLLETANVISNNVILLGDMNCDTSSVQQDKATKTLIDTCSAYQMTQEISKPTRITDNTKSTIDHIWTDVNQQLIKESGTFVGISDHLGTYAMLNLSLNNDQQRKLKFKRNWRNYTEREFTETLSTNLDEANVTDLISQKDLNGSMDALTNAIQKSMNQHAPLKEVKEKQPKIKRIPWFDQEISEKKAEKNNLLKLYYLLGDPKDKAKASKLNNEITHLKEKKKKLYYTNKLSSSEGDPKQIWNVLKELTNGYSEKNEIEPDNLDQEKANQYNEYFATVGSEIQKELNIMDIEVETKNTGFTFTSETEENVQKLLERIRTNVAVGIDGINAKVLKDGADIIVPILTSIINLSYELNQFPDQLKSASVKPIHKKNCHNDPANYRPISILPILSKVFERSAVNQLVKYLENGILSANQHAYRRFHSTVTSLAELTNKIYSGLDEGMIVGLASMDLSKAFDSISHTHLLQKLSDMGLHSKSVLWIRSYLQSRKQRTAFKEVTSKETEVTSGVPQGSILGPILFLCFTNELAAAFPNDKLISYADDSQFVVTGKTMEQIKIKLERIIQKAENWYKANSLKSNPSKTEVIIFTPNKNKNIILPTIAAFENGKKIELEVSETLKILGVHIDKHMTWNDHITKLRNKTMGIVKHLHRVNKLLPMKIKLQLYDSLVASHLNYADIIWSGCSLANKQKLQRVQNFALKSILGMRKFDSATEALRKLKYLNLEEKRKIHEGVFTHKVITGKMPENIINEYNKLRSFGSNRSAQNGDLKIPKHKTTIYEKSVLYRTIKTWNNTKVAIRNEETGIFKKKLQATYVLEIGN